MKFKFLLLPFIFFYSSISAQLQYQSPEAMNGYTLFNDGKLYLINNCGEIVKSWSSYSPAFHIKLLPNGNIVYIDWQTSSVIERDWDGNLISQTYPADTELTLEYEVIVLNNGNYLCLGRKDFSSAQFDSIGYDASIVGGSPHVDVVVELEPITGETVWIWNIADHVIQERSDTIPNYGIIKDHPELLNLDAISTFDWVFEQAWMINGMDYNVSLDQIVLSLRKSSEIIIIDHSTTTSEAASHSGGNSGKGGDILFRWGNPQNYNRGTEADRQLHFQHNPNWIEHGDHIGKIAIFNNGVNREGINFQNQYSNAPIIETPVQLDGSYSIDQNLPFAPVEPTINYGGLPNSGLHFFSNYMSGNKTLPNGNILLTVGDNGQILELKPDGTLVWDYILPTWGSAFRVEKYPADYPAFDGKDLTPQGTIESPSSTVPCDLVSNTNSFLEKKLDAWVDATHRQLFIQVENGAEYEVAIFNLLGKKLQTFEIDNSNFGDGKGEFNFPLSKKIHGILLLTLINKGSGELSSKKLFLGNN